MNLIKVSIAVLLSATLLACGGGGGSSDNSTVNPQATLKYSGNTNQATINSTNAPILATKVLSAQDDAVASGTGARTSSTKSAIDIAKQLALATGVASTRAVTRDTQPGSCGGTVTTTPGADSGTSFSGIISFSAYCDGFTGTAGPSITLNGTVVFSGTTATDTVGTQYISSLTMSFIDVSATQQPGTDTFVLAGSISFAFDAASTLLTMSVSMVVQDSSGKTLWLENYTIDETTSPGLLRVSGRLYHPDYGYVAITTPQALSISGKWPTSGQIVIAGANNVRARLTAVVTPSAGYIIEIDPGTGTFTPSTVVNPWPIN